MIAPDASAGQLEIHREFVRSRNESVREGCCNRAAFTGQTKQDVGLDGASRPLNK